jgi:hypothetical protein
LGFVVGFFGGRWVAAAVQTRRGFLTPFSAYRQLVFPTAVFWLDYRERDAFSI